MQRLWAAFIAAVVAATIGLAGLGAVQPPRASAADPCAAPVTNVVACENTKPGNPKSEWDVSGAGSTSIQGFATDISVNHGDRVRFKIKTAARSYRLDIYRMGYYGGNGARKVATISLASNPSPSQPACLTNSSTGLIDCGNWSESTSWLVPADAVSGIYFARLVRTDNTSGSSHVMFIVRDDASHSDLFFQTSDTTWQAYNSYGGNSLYTGSPAGRAYKVSYNRPFNTRGGSTEDWVFNSEYPMVRFLEANGYDVSYTTGVDSDRRGDLIKNHKAFLSVGHDEYWSAGQRAKVEAARDAGVNLAFFSGNEMFWKTRWENSIDSSGTAHRTLVCYKETHANAKIDPSPQWTGTWRDPRFSPPADGGRPENALIGQQFRVNSGTTSVQVSANEGKLRLWRGTRAATLASGGSTTIGTDTVGYEWDTDVDNGVRPKGVVDLSTTNAPGVEVLLDNGSTFGTGDAVHHLTLYRADSGALVFGAGSVQWSWGLDSSHDRGSAAADTAAKQATVNLFADMGVQPSSIQSGLTAASASTDTTAPSSTITSPTSNVAASSTVTISGTATDTGGVVAGVEVSTDGGATWHPATGTTSWSYRWRTPSSGSATIKTRATDDSGRTEAPATGVQVTVGGPPPQVNCPCSLWSATNQPTTPSDPDTTGTEVGVKFRADRDGTITGLRFYKGTSNTGTHVGHLWSRSGTQLASVNFTNESASGWQQATFSGPVPVTAGTTYVASYYAPNGRYAEDDGYFAAAGYGSSPLYALADGEDGANSVYRIGTGFPTGTYQSANYWVDVVFSTGSTTPETDTTPPSITSRTPASGATGVSVGTTVTATFSEPIQAETAVVSVKD